jgi:AraC-like DNA-binding protein
VVRDALDVAWLTAPAVPARAVVDRPPWRHRPSPHQLLPGRARPDQLRPDRALPDRALPDRSLPHALLPAGDSSARQLWPADGLAPGKLYSADLAAGALWAAGYREWLAPESLRHSLACFWISVAPPGDRPSTTAVLPDGCSDLIWQSGRGAYLAGPDTGPAPALLPPGTVIVAARFRPGAGGPALGLPLAEVRDQRVELADCLPRLARQLPADLDPDVALSRLTSLSARLASAGSPDALVLRATALLADSRTTVAGVSRDLAMSERQLRRRFDDAAGYGPKMMQRVLRFRHLVRHLTADAGGSDLADLAARLGYADQAHLTRETSRLAGKPPAALARSFRVGAS